MLMQSPLSSALTRSPAAAWKASADVQHCHGSQASPCLTLCPSYNLEASSAQSKPELEKLRASSVGWDGFCSHTINPLKPQRFIPGLAQSHRDCTGLCAAGLPARGEPGPGRRSQRSPWQAAVTDTSHHPAQHHSGDAASIKRNISTNPAHARASRGSASFRGSVKQHQPAGARLQVGRNKPGAFFFFFPIEKGQDVWQAPVPKLSTSAGRNLARPGWPSSSSPAPHWKGCEHPSIPTTTTRGP